MYDTISGISRGYTQGAAPKYVRLATDVKLTIQMGANQEESILKPLLELEYKVYETELITELSDIDASYYVDMFEDDSQFENTEFILGIVFNTFVFVIVVVRMFFWYRMNPLKHFNHPEESFKLSK